VSGEKGEVNNWFTNLVVSGLKSIDQDSMRVIKTAGITVRLGHQMSSMYDKQGQMNVDDDRTADEVRGMYQGLHGKVLMAQNTISKSGYKSPHEDAQSVMRHELGHAWDYAIGRHSGDDFGGKFSDQEEFREAVRADFASQEAMGINTKATNGYFHPDRPGDAGYREMAAETFAAVNGGGCTNKDYWTMRFPESTKVVKKYMKHYAQSYT